MEAMFIWSLRASSLKFFGAVCAGVLILLTVVALLPSASGAEDLTAAGDLQIKYDGIKTNDDRIDFLAQFGWSVAEQPIESVELKVPAEFDKVFVAYNQLQKEQGLDLSKYRRKTVTRYTYEVTNYEGAENGETVLANLIVYRNLVVAGDICSKDGDFVHGFTKPV